MMDKKRFDLLMGAVDDDLLEEAQQPLRRSRTWIWTAGSLAACVCILIAGYLVLRPGTGPEQTADQPPAADPVPSSSYAQIVNPMHEATAAQVAQLGYAIPLPADAQSVSYFLIDQGTDGAAPMAEVSFEQSGTSYTCRALKTAQAEDISGIYADWKQSLDWSAGTLDLQLRQAEDGTAWVGWYSAEEGTQWCLSGEEDALSLLHTAQAIVEALGYDLAVAPAEAEDVEYNAFTLDDLTVGETSFRLDGVRYSFRTASTALIGEDFADISGLDGPFQNNAAAQVQGRPAKLAYDEGGAGRIIWFDVVPGLLYSLSMDRGASESALVEMANQLFTPAQGEVG
ncbi:MAG: hypothetical protein ACI3XJ_01915 [Oscillospiraceae bacterium]